MSGRWTPAFGARLDESGVRMRVCAPGATTVRVHLDEVPPVEMARVEPDVFETHLAGARAGDRYRLPRRRPRAVPDPSRFQPEGVHGPSSVDPDLPRGPTRGWRGPTPDIGS